ncbi:glycosyltransferase family 2 protein [Aequorivita lipolytica]|uniref:Glycosyltransferase family 2 protein n=1 Tax=Aequorivita lipolytica TaxID=153267 RepID=A0A5C6YL79_9FLAO|nr:glycosyltransferase family 2 protein [Aequorivita lipolytica]TXD68163.1 glycosyltransferase family 2 protein [Aequorivita lipolytica]SRX53593.1 N-acetylglucosaminyl-diphospho-decaprenol L-rhamnosyltransferase [Aequorivita lipolytica]
MKLSVIILNYNVRYFLEQCILSVEKAIENLDAEIIVIDNDSKDGSCEMVKNRFPNAILIENKENVGFSKANNQAVAVAKGEYICILNPDTAVCEDTFQQSIKYSESIENIGALGVYLMDGTGNFLPESKRNLPTPKVSLMKLTGFTQKYYSNKILETSSGEVEVLVGAFMLLKRSIYNEVRGFDEDYFMYGEDIDLSYKITQAGYKNHYKGSTTVLHYKGESTKKDALYFERFYGAMQIFYRKHFNKNLLLEGSVSAGVALAKKARKFSPETKTKLAAKLERNYFFTENIELLEKLSANTTTVFQMVSKNMHEQIILKNSLLVFDAEYISYKEIFKLMKQLKGNSNLFRIRPAGCNFIIGSDRSDEKGGVLVF